VPILLALGYPGRSSGWDLLGSGTLASVFRGIVRQEECLLRASRLFSCNALWKLGGGRGSSEGGRVRGAITDVRLNATVPVSGTSTLINI